MYSWVGYWLGGYKVDKEWKERILKESIGLIVDTLIFCACLGMMIWGCVEQNHIAGVLFGIAAGVRVGLIKLKIDAVDIAIDIFEQSVRFDEKYSKSIRDALSDGDEGDHIPRID